MPKIFLPFLAIIFLLSMGGFAAASVVSLTLNQYYDIETGNK